jgi:uncharacterized damage-inducible protein DinB
MNEAMNRSLLDSLSEDQWMAPLAKGKTVRAQFAHMHNMRRRYLRRCGPDLLVGLDELQVPRFTRSELAAQMELSADAIAVVITRAGTPDGKVATFRHATAFLSYLAMHDACHRAQVEIALRQAGIPLDERALGRMWTCGRSAPRRELKARETR